MTFWRFGLTTVLMTLTSGCIRIGMPYDTTIGVTTASETFAASAPRVVSVPYRPHEVFGTLAPDPVYGSVWVPDPARTTGAWIATTDGWQWCVNCSSQTAQTATGRWVLSDGAWVWIPATAPVINTVASEPALDSMSSDPIVPVPIVTVVTRH